MLKGDENMNKKIIVAIIAVIGITTLGLLANAGTTYGDVICSEKFVPRHIYFCTNPDGSLKGFNTFEDMNNFYTPPKILLPESTYIYVDGSNSETLTG